MATLNREFQERAKEDPAFRLNQRLDEVAALAAVMSDVELTNLIRSRSHDKRLEKVVKIFLEVSGS